MPRPISYDLARAMYVHRYTMEHVPEWARAPLASNGKYYAPQYRSDAEWYEKTAFPGERGIDPSEDACMSTGQTWPLGQWLDAPYKR